MGIGFPVELESTESDGYVIRGVEVEVHQKKDNPHENGHYDALVRLTADLLPSVDPRTVIAELLNLAQGQVQAEIGEWLETIQEAHDAIYGDSSGGEPTMDETAKAPYGAPEWSPGLSGVGQDSLPRGPFAERPEEGVRPHPIKPLMTEEEGQSEVDEDDAELPAPF